MTTDDQASPAAAMRSRDPGFRAVLNEFRSSVSEIEPLWDQALSEIDRDQSAALDSLVELDIQIRHYAIIALESLLKDVDFVSDELDKALPDVD